MLIDMILWMDIFYTNDIYDRNLNSLTTGKFMLHKMLMLFDESHNT